MSVAAPLRPPVTPPPLSRRDLFLQGPVAATLFRLSGPHILVMLAQASTGLVEPGGCLAWAPMRWPAWRWCSP